MSDEKPPEILGGLPRTRPQRRSDKRAAVRSSNGRSSSKRQGPRGGSRGEALRQPKQPGGTPPTPASRRPAPPSGPEVFSTVVHAAAELFEIGLSAGGRAVRNALGRLPRP